MSEDDEKQHDPSQKRLEEARKRGDVPKSADLTTAAAYAGFLAAAWVFGTHAVQSFGQMAASVLDQSDRLSAQLFAGAIPTTTKIALGFGTVLAPFFLLPIVAVLLALVGQRAMIFAPQKLAVKWSRVSPLAIAGQKFGREGLFEFGKSVVKLVVIAAFLGRHLTVNAEKILASLQLSPAIAVVLMFDLALEFLFLVVVLITVFGCADFLWQKRQHLLRNRMSRKDMMDEMKDSEGDPHIKQQRRQRGHDIATNRMLQDVGKADVVVVNPTHYAVALKWNRKGRGAPICVAKGVDEIAARIREKAAEAGVPLHPDPPTARAIHQTVEIGSPVRPEHYLAVAAAIRFAEAMRKRKGAF